jgi:hypothetical protein
MRRTVLEVCASIAALLFLISLAAIAVHCVKRRRAVSLTEYLWAVVPWLMVAACAFPAVWPILTAQQTSRPRFESREPIGTSKNLEDRQDEAYWLTAPCFPGATCTNEVPHVDQATTAPGEEVFVPEDYFVTDNESR